MRWGIRIGILLGLAGSARASPMEHSAWVLVGQTAREDGLVIEISGQPIDATMPVEAERDLELTIVDGDRMRSAWLEGDLLYLVSGRRGKLRATRPGVDVDTDVVAVHADEEVARALADDAGAELSRDRGRWLLRGEDVLYELAYVPLPEGDVDVEPVPVERAASGQVRRRISTTRAPTKRLVRARRRIERPVWTQMPVAGADGAEWSLPVELHPRTAPKAGKRPPYLAGWYCDAAGCIVLGVDGWAHACSETGCVEAGRWAERAGGIDFGDARYVWIEGHLVRKDEGVQR